MAALKNMPPLRLDEEVLKMSGASWLGNVGSTPKPRQPRPPKAEKLKPGDEDPATSFEDASSIVAKAKAPNRFDKKQSMDFGLIFDAAFGQSLATMLGDIEIVTPKGNALIPSKPDCVEVGLTRIVGAIRPQNYDAAYRPDGPRIVYDSKTLNDAKSVGKNWQNMINDLTAEASTVHIRFPMCIVVFIIIVPRPALSPNQERDIIRTLERLGSRDDELDQHNPAEAAALVVWHPEDGSIDDKVPPQDSNLRLEKIHIRINHAYLDRYKNLPPHQATEDEDVDDNEIESPSVT